MGEVTNAFAGKPTRPTEKELYGALGSSAEAWEQLLADLATEYAVAEQEWKSVSPKYGWSLRLKKGKKTIIYLSPGKGCFGVALVLGNKAVQSAKRKGLSKGILRALEEAPRYAEGTGIRLAVRSTAALVDICKLVAAKMGS